MAAVEDVLSEAQAQALARLAQTTLEASADVLSDLVLHRVTTGLPQLSVVSWEQLAAGWTSPVLIVRVEYVSGVEGVNLLVMSARDARVIAALMMGETPDDDQIALDELHLSAVAEAMNQMMGSAATSLSDLLGERIDISPPVTALEESFGSAGQQLAQRLSAGPEPAVVALSFPLRIEDDLSTPIESRVVQLFPPAFARSLADRYLRRQQAPAAAPGPAAAAAAGQAPPARPAPPPPTSAPGRDRPAPPAPSAGRPAAAGAGAAVWRAPELPEEQIPDEGPPDRVPMELIRRITVPVTVRLGQAYLPLEEVLSLSRGAVVPLDVSDGQPVDVLVSGTLVARGEVVVVRERFGVRITELVRPGRGSE